MLNIIVNSCPKAKIKENFSEKDIFLNDGDIYKVLNGEEKFKEKSFSYEKMDLFVDALVATSVSENIIIHTFNPLVLNWFHDNVAIDAFIMLNESGEFIKIFSIERMLEKLKYMGAGEAVCDTDFSNFKY